MPSATMKTGKVRAQASFRPNTWNAETRTIDVVVSTGAAVRRYDWREGTYYNEELVIDTSAIRMERLNNGAAVLNAHSQWELGDQIGVVERAWLEGGELCATLRLSAREDIAGIVQDIVDGIIRNISVGYIPHLYEKVENRDNKIPTYRAVDWEPTEVSFVPVPADAGAQARGAQPPQFYEVEVRSAATTPHAAPRGTAQEERTMNPCPKCGASMSAGQDTCSCGHSIRSAAPAPIPTRTAEPPASSEDQIRADERLRINEIRRTATVARVDDSFAEDLIARGVKLEEARAQIINKAAETDSQTRTVQAGAPEVTADEADKVRAAMSDALILRANPRARLHKDEAEQRRAVEVAREFRGLDLVDLARERIEAAGGRTRGMSRREVAVAALGIDRGMMTRAGLSTSDFPEILAATVGRTLRQAYQLAPKTFEPFCRQTTAPDFKQVARTQLSDLSAMQKINEGGEYKLMQFGDSAEKYSLSKYGGRIAITWESIINDDLSAFDRLPLMIASEAAATEADIVYAILTGNPTMSDTIALFQAATHKNYTTGPGTAISDTSLGVGRALMRKQTGPKGRVLNLTPEFLIVGPDKESEANKYTSASFVAAKASDINPNFNTSLTVIVDGRISGNAWYLAASPSRIDTIEYAYLEGEEGLFLEQRQGFEVDGLEIKARHVFAAKAIDYRGLYLNTGA